ncbi:MAG: hypothetical protein CM15mP113_2050 [Pseudomonadota bacterium]|nr:MAG: hypothetical protein CM15mP113_2050 [Pseudomonadota bacterium]
MIIVDIRDDYVKVDGLYLIRKGDRITGNISGVSAKLLQYLKIRENIKLVFKQARSRLVE